MGLVAAIRVIPVGTCSSSLSEYVAEVVRVLEKRGVRYMLTPFNTSVELDGLEALTEILRDIVEMLRSRGIARISIDVSLDIRFDKPVTLLQKIESVEKRLRESPLQRDTFS